MMNAQGIAKLAEDTFRNQIGLSVAPKVVGSGELSNDTLNRPELTGAQIWKLRRKRAQLRLVNFRRRISHARPYR